VGPPHGSAGANERSGRNRCESCGAPVTREDAIQIGINTLEKWHASDHVDGCTCGASRQFRYRSAAVIDALIANGVFSLRTERGKDPMLFSDGVLTAGL
jgi:hypothetical protein